MRAAAIARNYAQTLLELADRHGGEATIDDFGAALEELNEILAGEPLIREFIETPLVDVESKKEAMRKTFMGRVPELFLRFLLVVIEKRRSPVLTSIAAEYQRLVDERRGQVRADVLLAREPDAALRGEIRASLERILGKTVLASYRVDPALVGGVVIRVGEQVFDGSVRRRVTELRRRLLATELPALSA